MNLTTSNFTNLFNYINLLREPDDESHEAKETFDNNLKINKFQMDKIIIHKYSDDRFPKLDYFHGIK